MPLKLAVRDRQTLAEYLGTVDVGGGQGVGHRHARHALVAQLVRASDCGSEGRWFESTRVYHRASPSLI